MKKLFLNQRFPMAKKGEGSFCCHATLFGSQFSVTVFVGGNGLRLHFGSRQQPTRDLCTYRGLVAIDDIVISVSCLVCCLGGR
jgi:hypothetical protein